MDCKFYVGQKVVCVGELIAACYAGEVQKEEIPVLRRIYTIESIWRGIDEGNSGAIFITLKEIGYYRNGVKLGYFHIKFKPLDEMRREMFNEMIKSANHKIEEEV